jgi:AcrR family transcriptional regulator
VSFTVKDAAWQAPVLPRGPHKLSADEVRASQRVRLLRAAVELVGEQGYSATTVPQVVARAKVSRNAFYDCFTDKADCFLAAVDQMGREFIAALTEAAGDADWLTMLRRGLPAYLEHWRTRPVFARAYFVELPSVGERAFADRDRQYRRFRLVLAELARRARLAQRELPPLAVLSLDAAVVTTTEVIARYVRQGRTSEINQLHDGLLYLLVRLLADDRVARAVLPDIRTEVLDAALG